VTKLTEADFEFKVERGIPIPPMPHPGRPYKYPWRLLEVGDSFFVPEGNLKTLRSAWKEASKRLGFRCSYRQEEGGIRIWRVE
jgi:hypothetical protein